MKGEVFMSIKKIFGIICIIVALCLITLPIIFQYIEIEQNESMKNDLLSEVETLLDNQSTENKDTTEPSNDSSLTPDTTTTETTEPTEETTTPQPYKPYRTSTNEEVDGILYIPAIDLELPILTNVTEKGLNKTCARVTNTGAPGCNNYCIMGHVMKNYGYIFNRLHEVKKGDKVSVKARDYTYNYVITEKFVTEGLDVNILEDASGKQLVTIFCCSYQVNNGRLVVRGELESIHYN